MQLVKNYTIMCNSMHLVKLGISFDLVSQFQYILFWFTIVSKGRNPKSSDSKKEKSGHSGSNVKGKDRDCGAVKGHSAYFSRLIFLSTNAFETDGSLLKLYD